MNFVGRPQHLLVVLLLLGLLASCSKPSVEVGGKAPDFSLRDMEGKLVTLSSFKGKVVMLEFWATWCPPCRTSVPYLQALDDKYSSKDFTLLTVSEDSDFSTLKPFVKEYDIKYPVLFDDSKVADLFKVKSVPTIMLIDKNGRIADRQFGHSDDFLEKYSTKIEALL